MTDINITEMPLAVFRRRPEGEVLTVEIEGGDEMRPPVVVQFRVPDSTTTALIEARTREAMLNLMQGKGAERRYGVTASGALDESTIASLAPLISAVESAALLITDWNVAYPDSEGRPIKAARTPEAFAELFTGRPLCRAGWTLQYETVSPLERAEGNVSAASLDTTSATAANTVGDAPRPEAGAAGAASDEPARPVPGP